MISRHIQYIWKEGMYELYTGTTPPAIDFVGGAPVIMEGVYSGYGEKPPAPPVDWSFSPGIYANGASKDNVLDNLKLFLGVAYHSRKVCSLIKKVTVIRAPAIITIFKGKAAMKEFQQAEEFFPFGFTEDDPYTPFVATRTYAQGDLLYPTKVQVGGVFYSVWTNDTTALPTGTTVLPARVLAVSGGTGEDQVLTIELGAFEFYKPSA